MTARLLSASPGIVFDRRSVPIEVKEKASPHVQAVQRAYDLYEPSGSYCVPLRDGAPAPLPAFGGWKLGVVFGASGGGKSSTLRLFEPDETAWFSRSSFLPDVALVQQVHDDPEEAQRLLEDVGLKSVPAWLTPYGALSAGQKARADLSRVLSALSSTRRRMNKKGGERLVLVVDEFGSLLDPVTREAMAYVFARAVERRAVTKSVVLAVNDARLLPWLQPSWVFDVDACEYRFAQRFLDVPGVREKLARTFRLKEALTPGVFQGELPAELQLRLVGSRARNRLWQALKHHHYLDHKMTGHLCFALVVKSPHLAAGEDVLAGLLLLSCNAAWAKSKAVERQRFAARFVVAPSVQGLGLGPRAAAMAGAALDTAGIQLRFTTSHQALVKAFERASDLWTQTKSPEKGSESRGSRSAGSHAHRPDRVRHFFVYSGKPSTDVPKLPKELLACAYKDGKNPCDGDDHCYVYPTSFLLRPPWK